MLKIIYLGTPDFAVPCLEALINESDFQVLAVVAQPDRPKGRGNKLMPPPTKVLAQAHGIPVLQPEKLAKAPDVVQAMRELKPDILAMVAFGQILKKEVLTLAPMGVVNVHGSLLPKLRGAAPINWSIINGDTVTGVTTMFTELGVDTGPMLLKAEIPIHSQMTAEELSREMSQVGAALLVKTLKGLVNGEVEAVRQNDAEATFAPILTKEMGKLDFNKSAQALHNLVRGLSPWPSTYTTFRKKGLKVLKCTPAENGGHLQPGTLVQDGTRLLVACGDGCQRLELLVVQPESRSAMEVKAFLAGAREAIISGEEQLG
mgnify:FL=1